MYRCDACSYKFSISVYQIGAFSAISFFRKFLGYFFKDYLTEIKTVPVIVFNEKYLKIKLHTKINLNMYINLSMTLTIEYIFFLFFR